MMPQKPTIQNMQQFYRQIKGKWNSLYPNYFNSNKSIAQGRRVSKQYSIADPTLQQISMAVGLCKVRNIIQPHKAYSRDFLQRGRLKVQIFDKDGKPIHQYMKTKGEFMKEVGKKLKQIRSNSQKK